MVLPSFLSLNVVAYGLTSFFKKASRTLKTKLLTALKFFLKKSLVLEGFMPCMEPHA
jgi:hypothetical protein